jgi:cytoskeletal protein RodZ
MQSIGETLRAARTNKKESLEDVSRATKIKIEVLAKLEADDFKPLGAAMYVKSFLKLYGDHLGLDGKAISETYLQNQGGLHRQGLRLETQATLMAERQNELHLPLGAVAAAVGGITLLLLAWYGYHAWQSRRAAPPTRPKPVVLPHAAFDPLYQPKTKPTAELLDNPEKRP